jgi:hypothetical protein
MKKILSTTLLFLSVAIGSSAGQADSVAGYMAVNGATHDTGIIKKDKRVLPDFHQLDINNFAGKIYINFGKKDIITVTADSSVVPLIKTEVEQGILTIGVKKNISTSTPIVMNLSAKNISELSADGAADIIIDSMAGEKNFNINLSGAASVTAQGKVEKIIAVISGAGSLQCETLVAEEVDISVSGGGSASVHAKNKLTAKASGAGRILYSGNPSVLQERHGAGSIKKMQ